MGIAEQLPTMENDALAALHANAKRLLENGTPDQQTAAAELLPSIISELAARNAAKLSKMRAHSKVPAKSTPKPASKSPAPKRAKKTKPAEAGA